MEQKQSQVTAGPRHTDPNFKGDLYEHIVIVAAMERGAHVYKNVGSSGKTDLIIEKDGEKISVDVKASSTHNMPQKGVFLVHVDTCNHVVSWGQKTKYPTNWKDFWS